MQFFVDGLFYTEFVNNFASESVDSSVPVGNDVE